MDFNGSSHSYRYAGEQSSSLTRFRSAPCSFFPSSSETNHVLGFEDKSVAKVTDSAGVGYQIFGLPPLYPHQSNSDENSPAANGFLFFDSLGSSNLPRQNSSPAGLFVSQNAPIAATEELTQLKRQSTFPSRPPSFGQEGNTSSTLAGGHEEGRYSPSLDKLLLYPDSVPCKVRAKRGCATHPRSIAERVRRTRISERMRKLQEIVPTLDKQTNIADMLDFAVEYIKDLQRQLKILNDNRANCKCVHEKKPILL